ncbi:MAG: hypothetical protein HWN80_03315 [Candidatus Lokiarchaeota archaeon]|nr:hypothetical protein [Candidatus Lokiarchaeota archaeon]
MDTALKNNSNNNFHSSSSRFVYLVELFFAPLGGILPTLNIGTFTSGQCWGIIRMTLVFLSWFLF